MPRCKIIAELATNHGGNIRLAEAMIHQAIDAGADIVKTQGYQIKHLRSSDPQYEWFKQCELSAENHDFLMHVAENRGGQYLSTGYCIDDLKRLKELGLTAVKIGSGEGRSDLVQHAAALFPKVYASLPWGQRATTRTAIKILSNVTWLATIPLYPPPIEAFSQVRWCTGYSDHHVGLDIAKMAIARGVTVLEKHFHLNDQECREQPWNMTPADLIELRRWTDICVQACDGTKYEGRWSQSS